MSHRILLISRTLGPGFGGMQTHVRTLTEALRARDDVALTVVGYGGGRALLPLFFLYALARSLCTTCGTVHVCDALLTPIFPILSLLRPRLKRSVTTHGLDVVWNVPTYSLFIGFCLRTAHAVAPVSRATADVCEQLGVLPERITVVPCGIRIPLPTPRSPVSGHVLLSMGRLVPRKGIAWFLENVFPLLLARTPSLRFIIAGDGPELPTIRGIVASLTLQHAVDILGPFPERMKRPLFHGASLFVMPNIPVAFDMEGFGITAIEAASEGVPVIAADLEGLKDSVLEGITGLHFTPFDLQSAAIAVETALSRTWNADAMRSAVQETFDATVIASRYVNEIF